MKARRISTLVVLAALALVAATAAHATPITFSQQGQPGPFVQFIGNRLGECHGGPDYNPSMSLAQQVIGRSPAYPGSTQYVYMQVYLQWSWNGATWTDLEPRKPWRVRTVQPGPSGDARFQAHFAGEEFDLSPYYLGIFWRMRIEFQWYTSGYQYLGRVVNGLPILGIWRTGNSETYTLNTGEGVCRFH
jgi:hypothetical protein